MRLVPVTLGVATAAAALLTAACGGSGPGAAAPTPGEPRTLTVFAAASLTDTFGELEQRFEADHPGVDVVHNFSGSSDLAQQIVNGAPADVFAAASDTTMTTVTRAGLADGEPTAFATNALQIATAPGNPRGIASFADLANPDVSVVVCAPQVPCGAPVDKVEQATGVVLSPVSEEPDVRSALGKVTTGNADAGLVYVTDVRAAGNQVQGVDFPEAARATTNYPITVLRDAPQKELASQFRDLVTGDAGRRVLGAAGFGPP